MQETTFCNISFFGVIEIFSYVSDQGHIASLTICSLSDHVHTIDVNSLILREQARIWRKDVEERREDFLSVSILQVVSYIHVEIQGTFLLTPSPLKYYCVE